MPLMYDIHTYLQFTKRKLRVPEWETALALAAKGKLVLSLVDLPEEDSPRWRLLHERY